MKEWKIRQEIFHRLNKTLDDDLTGKTIHHLNDDKKIALSAILHFRESDLPYIYPSKSYVVGICYAKWLSQDFNENFYELLDDKDLLYGNDPYFKPYFEKKYIYDKIIESVFPFDDTKGMIPHIRKYYDAEITYINN